MFVDTKPATTKIAVDHATQTIKLSRRLECTPQEAFQAWTRPEEVTLWWDPSGKKLKECKIDLKVGGAFAFVHDHTPPMPPFAGTYREIVPGERLVFDAMGAVGTVVLQASNGGTRMVVEIACRDAEHLEQFVRMGIDKGTARTLDQLADYVSKPVA